MLGTCAPSMLLPDLGMHLTEAGFFKLLEPQLSKPDTSASSLDRHSWAEEWEAFLSEAKRFDERKLMALFGDDEVVTRPPSISDKLTLRDRKLIGEFLRRQHPRLAHEIALFGFPAREAALNVVSEDLPYESRDLSGLIARSHGRGLRELLEILEAKFHLRDYNGAHAVFLMVVLRVADYLQVQSERAPNDILRIRDIKSPLSQGEWKAHAAIRNITFEGIDPEAIEIHAEPSNVATYLKLKSLMQGLQLELDTSWAILGEVYGRFPRLSNLGLELRRVRSNLDKPSDFAASVSYIPELARFTTADSDLLRLLAEPLYGADVNIAVRELLQNAVDACREGADYRATAKTAKPRADQRADVLIQLSKSSSGAVLTVSDTGIGMTAETVINYFLKAGASYRSSNAWSTLHEEEKVGSRVLRSGRFGIGVLAAFLLGKRISVQTRHIAQPEDEGLAFSAEINSDAIELVRAKLPIGTRITVELSSAAIEGFEKLKHDRSFGQLPNSLYLLEAPTVEFEFDPEFGFTDSNRILWPGEHAILPAGWHNIAVPGYSAIHWSYISGSSGLACNGIAIGDYIPRYSDWAREWRSRMIQPNVSIFDPNGQLPLTLTRTELSTGELPFQKELVEDICRDLLAFCLIDDLPEKWRSAGRTKVNSAPACDYPGIRDSYSYLLGDNWFTLFENEIFKRLDLTYLALVSSSLGALSDLSVDAGLLVYKPNLGMLQIDRLVRDALHQEWYENEKWSRRVRALRLEVPPQVANRWPNTAVTKGIMQRFQGKAGKSGRKILELGEPCEPLLSFQTPSGGLWLSMECSLVDEKANSFKETILQKTFEKHLGSFQIPYDLNDRRRRFPKAFKDLDKYIQAHLERKSHRRR